MSAKSRLQRRYNNFVIKSSSVKPGKLANDLNGYNKKNKLGLKGLSPEDVAEWLKP